MAKIKEAIMQRVAERHARKHAKKLIEQLSAMNDRASKYETWGDNENDDFVISLGNLKSHLDLADGVAVIYPGSSTHLGVVKVFGKESVTHVDPDVGVCDSLNSKGYFAVPSKIEDFVPDHQVDVIVALNSYGVPNSEIISRLVVPGGLIIANNYTHWAAALSKLEEVTLESGIFPDYSPNIGNFLDADQMPPDATSLHMEYWTITPEGRASIGTPEEHNFAQDTPRFPDALFVFRYNPST